MLENYLKKIFEVTKQGDAREESYYSTLETLLNEYADSSGKKNVHVTTLPKKTEAGNPDFRIWDGKQHVIGYIEAKQPTIDNLNQIETSEQLKRYRHTFPNLILTNFFEFRLYRDGELVESVQVGRPFIAHKLKTATERYQDLGAKEEHYAEATDRYGDFNGAVGCMLKDCGFRIQPGSQMHLFEGQIL